MLEARVITMADGMVVVIGTIQMLRGVMVVVAQPILEWGVLL